MRVEYTINNYQLGARFKSSPKHKVVINERIDKNHTRIVYEFETEREKQFVDRLFSRSGIVKE